MPIIGLTDQAARFPQIGQLRKGAPKPEKGNRPGADLEWFRFDSKHEDVTTAFVAAYGNEPAAINVFLPFATPEQNFTAWQEEYVASGLVHRCDGETMTQWLTEQNTYSFEPKPCPYHAGEKKRTAKQPGCKPTGRLMVIIPELKRLAYVMVGTTSIHDIMELSGNLNAAYAFRGDLTGIPFVLRRMPKMISTPSGKNGGKARREKWLLFLEPAPEWVGLQIESMRYNALPSAPGGNQLSLPGPETITVDAMTGEILDDDDDDTDVVESTVIEQEQPASTGKPMPDDELVIKEAAQSEFFKVATELIPRYSHPKATTGCAKKLGYTVVPGNDYERVEMYKAIRDYAAERDSNREDAPAEEDALKSVLNEVEQLAAQNPDSIHAE